MHMGLDHDVNDAQSFWYKNPARWSTIKTFLTFRLASTWSRHCSSGVSQVVPW